MGGDSESNFIVDLTDGDNITILFAVLFTYINIICSLENVSTTNNSGSTSSVITKVKGISVMLLHAVMHKQQSTKRT